MAEETNNQEVFNQDSIEFIEPEAVAKEEVQEEKVEEKEEQSKEESRESILERLKNKVFGKAEEKKEEDTQTTGKKEVEELISENFEKAARQAGWTNEQIIQFAEKYTNAELDELVPQLMEEEKEEEKKEEVKSEKKIEVSDNKVDANLKAWMEQVEKSLEAKYQEKIKSIEDRLVSSEKDRSVREAQATQKVVDEFFDKASEEFPTLGKTSDLMKFPEGTPQAGHFVPVGDAYNSRKEILKTAQAFTQMGMSVNEALQEALSWYKGKNLEKDVRSKVLKDLKKQEQRVSPKRSGRITTKEALSRRELIDELAAKAGL